MSSNLHAPYAASLTPTTSLPHSRSNHKESKETMDSRWSLRIPTATTCVRGAMSSLGAPADTVVAICWYLTRQITYWRALQSVVIVQGV